MIEVTVHTQKMMSGRIDIKCPNCNSLAAYYTKVAIIRPSKKCLLCNYLLPDGVAMYHHLEDRINWHFYRAARVILGAF